jgi:integrase
MIRRSATNDLSSVASWEGAGRTVGVPYGRTRWSPVFALEAWLALLETNNGPLFRRIDRHGRILATRISGEAVSLVVKQRVEAAGLSPEEFSGHSLRAGLATSAAAAGVSSWKIRQQAGHASDAMLARYIRNGEMFIDNAASALL